MMPLEPDHEFSDTTRRLAALGGYAILDTPREESFDELVALAASICNAPISVVNLIEEHRQWFKAEVGLGIRETPIDVSICRHVLLQPGITVINDLQSDSRMCSNPLVSADDGLRFYAGCLLETPEGIGIGTLCILDRVPRTLRDDQLLALKTLGKQVMAQMELRKSLRQKEQLLEQKEMLLKEVNHRTTNNLQMINNLVQLQLRQVTDATAKAALLDTSRRISSIAAVHQNLYRADHVESVDAAAYLHEVIKGIEATAAQGIHFELAIQSVMLPLDIAVPLALMVNELATNSLKYAYAAGVPGTIRVSLHKTTSGLIELSVEDEGRGLPVGFEQRKSASLGMRIITSLAKGMNAQVVFTNKRPGAKCVLGFQLKA